MTEEQEVAVNREQEVVDNITQVRVNIVDVVLNWAHKAYPGEDGQEMVKQLKEEFEDTESPFFDMVKLGVLSGLTHGINDYHDITGLPTAADIKNIMNEMVSRMSSCANLMDAKKVAEEYGYVVNGSTGELLPDDVDPGDLYDVLTSEWSLRDIQKVCPSMPDEEANVFLHECSKRFGKEMQEFGYGLLRKYLEAAGHLGHESSVEGKEGDATVLGKDQGQGS